jgi:hypothetical protein
MWAALTLSTVLNLAPAQAKDLELKNVRLTYGMLGQERPESKQKLPPFNPGDVFVLTFDIDNLMVKKDGRVQYSMEMELVKKGKGKDERVFKKHPQDLEVVNALGGARLPGVALWGIPIDTPPSQYTMSVTVTDRLAKKTATLTRSFEVIKPRFGFAAVGLTYPYFTPGERPALAPAPAVAVPGQNLLLNFSLVGFELDKKKKMQPDITLEVRVLDSAGRPTVPMPFTGKVKTIREGFNLILPFDPVPLELNRSGKFKIVLKATDHVAKDKEVEVSLDLLVIDPKSP